jgi:hypothetical protein
MHLWIAVFAVLWQVAVSQADTLSNPCDGAGPGSECFGSSQQVGQGDKMTMIGHNADTLAGGIDGCFSQCTCIGDSCEAWSFESTAVGYHAAALGNDTVCVGVQCQAGQSGVFTGGSSIAIGVSAFCVGESSECIGRNSGDGGGKDDIVLGRDANSGGVNSVFVVGSPSHPVTDGYINASPKGTSNRLPFVQHGAGGRGPDSSGSSYKISGGSGTGNAAGGDVALQTSAPLVSGAQIQPPVDRILARGKLLKMTDSVPAKIVRLDLGPDSGAAITLSYGARARSFPNIEEESGIVTVACSEDDDGTVSVGKPVAMISDSGSLKVTFSATADNDACSLQATLNSSLTAPSEDFYYTILNNGLQPVRPF